MRPRFFAALAPAVLLMAAPLFSANTPSFDPKAYLDHVKYLASPELKGRASGSPELEKAAQYIASQFKSAGLKPLDGKSYLQPFEVTTNARLGRNNHFSWRAGDKNASLAFEQQFTPVNFSSSGSIKCSVIFAGYGITAREYNYDDFAGIDAKDKCVVLMRHEPQEYEESSVFSGKIYTEHSQLFSKAANAKMHGARAVIFVNDVGAHSTDTDELEPFARTVGPANAGIPFIHVKAEVVEQWLSAQSKSLREIQTGIDHSLRPNSFALAANLAVEMTTDLRREVKTVHNVIGYLPGLTDEHVVLGAHYDHLGLGEQFSMAPSLAGTPHVGADDNASGSAGVIELARWFASKPKARRGIVFMTFAGEELGLLGSSYYANHASLPIEKTVAMINMDMIGRIRDKKVFVGGLGTGSSLQAIMEQLRAGTDLKLEFSDKTGYGSSDHTSFTSKQVPVLFFFSGLHADYHKPSDTWEKIEAGEAANLLDLIASLTTRLTTSDDRPQFVRVVEPQPPHVATGAGSSAPGYGPYFGSIPDFAEPPTGVRFSDVREGSPAAKAGLKGADILIEFDRKPIQNLYDFTYALRSKQPGETVRVKVLRDGKPLEVDVLLEKRR